MLYEFKLLNVTVLKFAFHQSLLQNTFLVWLKNAHKFVASFNFIFTFVKRVSLVSNKSLA